jgi:D-alanyl-D-alanine dipeptidase
MLILGYIAELSGHSRGGAVDLTLFRLCDMALLPMGGGFDLMDPISHHGAPGITDTERENRGRLRAIMEECGFVSYASEWWHYSLKDEPYPDTYFNFPIR